MQYRQSAYPPPVYSDYYTSSNRSSIILQSHQLSQIRPSQPFEVQTVDDPYLPMHAKGKVADLLCGLFNGDLNPGEMCACTPAHHGAESDTKENEPCKMPTSPATPCRADGDFRVSCWFIPATLLWYMSFTAPFMLTVFFSRLSTTPKFPAHSLPTNIFDYMHIAG